MCWGKHVAVEVNADDISNGLFSLEQRAGSIGCCLFANSHTVENSTIELPDNSLLVINTTSAAMHLKNVTFQGVQWKS